MSFYEIHKPYVMARRMMYNTSPVMAIWVLSSP